MRHLIHVHKPGSSPAIHPAGSGSRLDSLGLLVGGVALLAALAMSLLAGILWLMASPG